MSSVACVGCTLAITGKCQPSIPCVKSMGHTAQLSQPSHIGVTDDLSMLKPRTQRSDIDTSEGTLENIQYDRICSVADCVYVLGGDELRKYVYL